ncbi:unnamed protein product [Parascedosporium putredinis]|uniref:DUF7068 domain-containing protein n=1 Tax=Parascedosporium putredinis TaxID=1442378 RepID=A0A9P1GWH0_9PEZI|nr:unnamed protein product [Parascedosporium putredinis]CAI7988828.1 unnamed protein product [Parascedosporium putredinis]
MEQEEGQEASSVRGTTAASIQDDLKSEGSHDPPETSTPLPTLDPKPSHTLLHLVSPTKDEDQADIDIIAIPGLDTRSPETWTWKPRNKGRLSRALTELIDSLVDATSACLDIVSHPLSLTVPHVLMNKFPSPDDPNYQLVSEKIRWMLLTIRGFSSPNAADNYIRERHYTPERLQIERISGDCLPMDTCYINLALIQHSDPLKGARDESDMPKSSPFSYTSRLMIETPDKSRHMELAKSSGHFQSTRKPDLELETVGFQREQVNDYLEATMPDAPDKVKVKDMKLFLTRNPLLHGLVRIPIQLDAFCFTWDESSDMEDSPQTMTDVYCAIENKLWKKDIPRLGLGGDLCAKTHEALRPHDFLQRHKYNSRYDIFWRFVSGLLYLGLEKDYLSFFKALEQEPVDLLGPSHQRLIMHCLNEAGQRTGQRGEVSKLRAKLEERLLQWLYLECNYTGKTYLARETEFPNKVLERALKEGSRDQRRITVEALRYRAYLSELLEGMLMALLQDTDLQWNDKNVIISLLQKQPNLSEATVNLLLELMKDEDGYEDGYSKAAKIAAEVLTRSNLPATAVNQLLAMLEDAGSKVQEQAIKMLAIQSGLTQFADAKLRALLATNPRILGSMLKDRWFRFSTLLKELKKPLP